MILFYWASLRSPDVPIAEGPASEQSSTGVPSRCACASSSVPLWTRALLENTFPLRVGERPHSVLGSVVKTQLLQVGGSVLVVGGYGEERPRVERPAGLRGTPK